MNRKTEGLDLLRDLCLEFGPSGCEDRVADLIKENIEGSYDELIPDRMGGVVALVRGNGKSDKKVMLSAHMDEVGFMVREVRDDGLICFSSMMGPDTRIMAGRRVTVGDVDRLTRGVMTLKPVHTVDRGDRDKAAPIDELYIDIGASSKEEAEKYVKLGDYGTFESDFVQFGENGRMLKAKALDDRLGCALLIETMRKIYANKENLTCDVYFAFTCREELGIGGARCTSHKLRPDYALVFEATAVADIYGVPETSRVGVRGEGGVLSLVDRSTIYDKGLTELILNVAKENGIPCQIKKYVSGGNDASHIQRAAEGVKCAAISAPCGYIHTASDVIALSDYEAMCDLAMAVLERMSENA